MARRNPVLYALVLLLLVQCRPDEGDTPGNPPADPKKPSWWPDPPMPDGMPWPPPRPPGNDDPEWPPLKEVGEAPGFWVKLYGETADTVRDPRFKEPGHLGNAFFRRNFREVLENDERPPGCGLIAIRQFAGAVVPTCDPFPEMVVRGLCARALDEKTAETRCRVVCQHNEKRCRRDELYTPPLSAGWGCVPTQTDPLPGPYAACDAHFLCNCWEN